MTLRVLIALMVGGSAMALSLTAQTVPKPLSLSGTVVRQTLDGTRVVPREMVTLHRVNSKDAGAIDSLETDARGRYAFRVDVPDSQSMYLVSARYGGIAYFSQPAQGGVPIGPGEIVVYDTTSADVRLQLQGRHFVVSSPNPDGVRSVIDVLEIENDTVLTRVAGGGNRPTYSVLLPDGARNVRATQGEAGDGAVEAKAGRAELYAPLSPGLRQLVLTYDLPASAFPVSIALERTVGVLEVLLEEPGASAAGGGIENKGGVSVDGKNFTRFLGQSAPAAAVLTLSVPGGAGGTSAPAWLLPLVLTLVTLGVIVALARRGPASRGAVAVAGPGTPDVAASMRAAPAGAPMARAAASRAAMDPATQLARRAAALDALLERDPAPSPALAEALRASRAAVARELADTLAHRT